MGASFDTCGQLWISANRNCVNSAELHSSECCSKSSLPPISIPLEKIWNKNIEASVALVEIRVRIEPCLGLHWFVHSIEILCGGYHRNVHKNEYIFKVLLQPDDLYRNKVAKACPPVQLSAMYLPFWQGSPLGRIKYIATCTGTSGKEEIGVWVMWLVTYTI